ncbi:hypothetical protein ACFO5R_18210 [Halosolutus amylolyticus]|uniref:MYND-type domain-containing protein n=1 Tax=Halosolutus amylolyticus TaxID=2932267 RepID=A0ABD5PU89_9EURY|nr:hypothetical protein [Halosolutus amylolyticus]
MNARCPLCRRPVPGDAQHWCECGYTMDARCSENHRSWCAVHGEDAWIGALEL